MIPFRFSRSPSMGLSYAELDNRDFGLMGAADSLCVRRGQLRLPWRGARVDFVRRLRYVCIAISTLSHCRNTDNSGSLEGVLVTGQRVAARGLQNTPGCTRNDEGSFSCFPGRSYTRNEADYETKSKHTDRDFLRCLNFPRWLFKFTAPARHSNVAENRTLSNGLS
jgi:hypothetical protein